MIRLIRFLITGSWHKHECKWDTVDEFNVCNDGVNFKRYVLKCNTCGELKTFDTCKKSWWF